MKPQQVLVIAERVGNITLCSGAEIYRVVITIEKIFEAYSIKADCYVIATGIFISVKDKCGETYTSINIVRNRSIVLNRLEEINDFARSLLKNKFSFEEALQKLDNIENNQGFSLDRYMMAAGSIAFFFSIFFGSNYIEAMVSGCVAIIVYYLQAKYFSKYFFTFFDYFLSTMTGTLLCLLVSVFSDEITLSKLITGFIMILVPGGTITIGMKDALYGDVISSSYKFFETVFISVAIGLGIVFTLMIRDGLFT